MASHFWTTDARTGAPASGNAQNELLAMSGPEESGWHFSVQGRKAAAPWGSPRKPAMIAARTAVLRSGLRLRTHSPPRRTPALLCRFHLECVRKVVWLAAGAASGDVHSGEWVSSSDLAAKSDIQGSCRILWAKVWFFGGNLRSSKLAPIAPICTYLQAPQGK
jgi:hypothetical protein